MAGSFTDSVSMIWVVLSFLVQPLFLVKLFQWFQHAGGFPWLCEIARSRIGWGRWKLADDSQVDASAEAQVLELVARLLKARRIRIARLALFGAWVGCCIGSWSGCTEGLSTFKKAMDTGSTISRLGAIINLVATTLAVIFPQTLVQERSLPVWLFLATCLDCGVQLSQPFTDSAIFNLFLDWPKRSLLPLFFAALFLKFRYLVGVNIVYAVTSFMAYYLYKEHHWCADLPADREIFLTEGALCVGRLVVTYCAEWAITHGARKEVEAACGKCQGSAVSAMLGLLCDAVVDLDSELAIKPPVNSLAGLLMHTSTRSLLGARLSDFVAAGEDRERFASALEGDTATSEDPSPHMITVRLRDSTGSFFRTVLYQVPYVSVDGRLNHLIGIQESSNENGVVGARRDHRQLPAAVLTAEVKQALAGSSTTAGEAAPAPPIEGEEDGSESSFAGSGSSSSNSTLSGSKAARAEHITLGIIRVAPAEGLPVVGGDDDLRRRLKLTGPSHYLVEVVPNKGSELCKEILEAWAKVKVGVTQPNPGCFGHVRLALSGGKANGTQCRVIAKFPDPSVVASGAEDVIELKLGLVIIKRKSGWKERNGPLRATMDSDRGSEISSKGSAKRRTLKL